MSYDLNPMKIGKKKSLDPETRVQGAWRDPWHFSRKIGEVKDIIDADVKGVHKSDKPQQK